MLKKKGNKKKKLSGNICRWIFGAFCMTALMAYGFKPGALLIALSGIAALPIEPVRKLWERVPFGRKKAQKGLVLAALFVAGLCIVPSPEEQTDAGLPVTPAAPAVVQTITPTPAAAGMPEKDLLLSTNEPVPEQEKSPAWLAENELQSGINSEEIPEYAGEKFAEINGGIPFFKESDFTKEIFESYSELDELGRCGTAYANIGQETMPDQERGSIGMVKPAGWQLNKYDFVDGGYLYNRCHLIGYQLAGENDNEKNLITGTRYMNTEGMLPFENRVAGYVQETGNHVLYRVTPVYDGKDLVAKGILMEACSVEDKGESLKFNVFCYNIQPGVIIDYATGENQPGDALAVAASPVLAVSPTPEPTPTPTAVPTPEPEPEPQGQTYVLNTNSRKFHYPSCSSVGKMKGANKSVVTDTREAIVNRGYEPCGNCHP